MFSQDIYCIRENLDAKEISRVRDSKEREKVEICIHGLTEIRDEVE